MNTNLAYENEQWSRDLKAGITKRVGQVFFLIAFQAAMLFLSSGKITWWEAWLYIGAYLVGVFANAAFMLRYNPETIAERAEARENWKSWDKVIGGLFGVMFFVVMLVVAGLDERFGWTESMSLALQVAALVVFVLGFALFSWSMLSNAFFSSVVRIQDDRKQTVATGGPYRYVRHPGYVGAIIQSLSMPLMLGSWWTLIPGGLAALLLIARTALEDKTLRDELDGYTEYARRVRFRLLPGVW